MGLAHLTRTMNAPTDRGTLAFAHVQRLSAMYGHWPQESFDTGQASLPTLRLLRYIQAVPGLEMKHIPPLCLTNEIASSVTEASRQADSNRRMQRNCLPTDMADPKEYSRLRRATQPLQASKRLLKHLSPLWTLKLHSWRHALVREVNTNDLAMLPIPAILANAMGDALHHAKPTLLTSAKNALNTLRHLLSHPADTEYSKLPPQPLKPPGTPTAVHPSWRPLLPADNLPLRRHGLRRPSRPAKTPERVAHKFAQYLVPCSVSAPYDVLEVSGHDTIGGQRRYKVTKWAPEVLTRQEIDQYLADDFELDTITPNPARPDEEQTYTVQCAPSWQSEEAVLGAPSGQAAIEAYNTKAFPRRKARRPNPPAATCKLMGWVPKHTTFRTSPINPDLDSYPTADYTLRAHPTQPHNTVIHDMEGMAKGIIDTDRLRKLHSLYDPAVTTETFPSLILQQIITQGRTPATIAEVPIKHAKEEAQALKEDPTRHTWTIPDALYSALDSIFSFDRILNSTPLNTPLSATCRTYSEDPTAAAFSMLQQPPGYVWPGASLSVPFQTPQSLRRALEHAVYSAHHQRRHNPSATVLILPSWTHSPYLAKHLRGSPYVHKIMTIPARRVTAHPSNLPVSNSLAANQHMHVYLVANSLALQDLDLRAAAGSLVEATRSLYATNIHITLPPQDRRDGTEICSTRKYVVGPPEHQMSPPRELPPLDIRPHSPTWRSEDFVYTDGSVVKGRPTIGAGVVFPGGPHHQNSGQIGHRKAYDQQGRTSCHHGGT